MKWNAATAIAYGIIERLSERKEEPLSDTDIDDKSNGHIVKRQLRCAVSGCFDMDNICCKDCYIKNCRYKCNFIDKEVCEHQFI